MAGGMAGRFRIEADHPCLPGHFPDRPLVPGVVLLDRAFGLIEAELGVAVRGVVAAKFLVPVRPEQTITVQCRRTRSDRVSFECHAGETLVLHATARLGA